MPSVHVASGEVAYKLDGAGPPLVLVPGTGVDAEVTWGHLVERFTDRHTVVRPDFVPVDDSAPTGEGAAGDGPAGQRSELTVAELAGQVEAVIRATGGEEVDLVGFSLGAVVAATVAATHPELVRRLVLTAGWSGPDDPYLWNHMTVWRRLADADPEAFGRFGALTAFSPDFLRNLGAEQVEGLARNTRPTPQTLRQIELNLRLDIRDLLPSITAPTLVIGCAQDRTIPVQNARELHAAIGGSQYAELDSGHVVLFERPDEFVTLVRDFLHRP